MLEWCRPDYVVISGNHRAIRPAVLQEYAAAQTYVTHRDGAVQIRIDPQGKTSLRHWIDGEWTPISPAW